MSYSAVEQLYSSAKPSVFSHIVLNSGISYFDFYQLNQTIATRSISGSILFAIIFKTKNERMHVADMVLWMCLFLSMVMH